MPLFLTDYYIHVYVGISFDEYKVKQIISVSERVGIKQDDKKRPPPRYFDGNGDGFLNEQQCSH